MFLILDNAEMIWVCLKTLTLRSFLRVLVALLVLQLNSCVDSLGRVGFYENSRKTYELLRKVMQITV